MDKGEAAPQWELKRVTNPVNAAQAMRLLHGLQGQVLRTQLQPVVGLFCSPHMVIFLKKCIVFYCPLLELYIDAASIDGNHFLNSAVK